MIITFASNHGHSPLLFIVPHCSFAQNVHNLRSEPPQKVFNSIVFKQKQACVFFQKDESQNPVSMWVPYRWNWSCGINSKILSYVDCLYRIYLKQGQNQILFPFFIFWQIEKLSSWHDNSLNDSHCSEYMNSVIITLTQTTQHSNSATLYI
jgi:hypothetical protein